MSTVSEVDASSFDLPARQASGERRVDAVAVCVHGLTATPAEVRPVAEVLCARGIRSVGPTLPGHGTSPEELTRVTCEEWLATVRVELDKAHAEAESVFLVGSSLGGLVSLALAAERPVDGIAVVGVPLEFGWLRSRLPGLLKHVRPYLSKDEGPGIRDPQARARHVTYPVMPLAAVEQLVRLQRVVCAQLESITSPVFVAHGTHDTTASRGDSHRILEAVASERRESLWAEDSAHIVTQDHDGPALSAAIAEFFWDEIEGW